MEPEIVASSVEEQLEKVSKPCFSYSFSSLLQEEKQTHIHRRSLESSYSSYVASSDSLYWLQQVELNASSHLTLFTGSLMGKGTIHWKTCFNVTCLRYICVYKNIFMTTKWHIFGLLSPHSLLLEFLDCKLFRGAYLFTGPSTMSSQSWSWPLGTIIIYSIKKKPYLLLQIILRAWF